VDSCIFDNGTTICVNATLKASGQVCGIMGTFSCIGIGTNTPGSKLQVCGNTAIGYSTSKVAPTNGLSVAGYITGGQYGGSANSIVNLDMSNQSGWPAARFLYPCGGKSSLMEVAGSGIGINDIWFQGLPATTAGYTILMDYNGAGLYLSTAGTGTPKPIIFNIFSSEKMRIDGCGNVGIGSSSPCAKLHINATSAGDDLLYFCDGSSTATKFVYNVKNGADDALILRRNHTTQGNLCIMSWTYGGNVGIGIGTPSNVLDIAKAAQDSMVILTESSDNGDCTALFYSRRSRGTSLTSPTAIQSANNLGGLAIGGHDGSSYKMGAKIFGLAAENWSAGCNGTDIIFSTNSTAKCLPTEKVRINASGLVNFACNICVNNNVIIYNGSNSFYAWTNCSSFQPGLYGQICIGSSMTGVYTKMYGSGVDAGLFGINTQCMAFVGTDGACGKGMLIGTANNAPIYVGTNNVEAFRVTTNQYLLLGSTQNSYKLEVTAPTNTNASYFRAGGTAGYAAIAFSGDGGQAIGVLSTVSNDIIYLGTANGTIGNQFGTNGEFAIQKGSNTNILKLMCTGVACFAGAICVNEAVYVCGSFPGVKLDRAATSAQSDVNWKNAGTSVWSIGTAVKAVGSCLDFYSYSISDNVMRFTPAGIVTKPYQPSFLAYGMGNTTLNSYVIYPSVHLNKGSHYNASTGVFTAPVAGVYYFSWSAIGNTPGSVYRWFLHINNATFLSDYHLRQDTNETGDAYATNGNRDVIINLAANDTVRIYFVSDSSTLPYGVNDTTSPYLNFMGYLLG
jgi:hypothetical protein